MSSGLHLTQQTATYMKALYMSLLSGNNNHTSPPPEWSTSYLRECNHAVNVLIQAQSNRESTTWDAETYINNLTIRCTGQNTNVEADLREQFPPIHVPMQYLVQPGVVTDANGKVLMWYLPGVLMTKRHTHMWDYLSQIEPTLTVTKGSNWRTGPDHYHPGPAVHRSGTVTMAPAWFQQAHENTGQLEVSQSLTRMTPRGWLKHQVEFSALVGGIVSIIHPELYAVGIAALQTLQADPRRIHKGEYLDNILPHWSSPLQVMTIISNRQTPYHRDNGGDYPWFDVLVPLGSYRQGCLEFPGLGTRYLYDPGCVVAFTSRVLQHGVNCGSDRAVLAYYMKTTFLASLGLQSPTWAIL